MSDSDIKLLDRLRKALAEKASTDTGKQPWQEELERLSTVSAKKSVQAAEVIRNFVGSWAAQANYFDPVSSDLDTAEN